MQFKLMVLFFVVRYCVSVSGVPIEETAPSLSRYFGNRIVGGSQAPKGQFPYMAAILIGDDVITLVVCGGTLVLPNLILTAAHCMYTYQTPGGLMRSLHAVVGSNNFKSGGIKVEFGGYHIHPDWNQVSMKNDIGFICLKKKLALNDKVQLVAMNFEFIDRVEPSFVVGWGLITGHEYAIRQSRDPTRLCPSKGCLGILLTVPWNTQRRRRRAVDPDIVHNQTASHPLLVVRMPTQTRPSITPFNLQILEVDTLEPQDCVDRVSAAAAVLWPDAPTVDPDHEICSFHSKGVGHVTAGLCYGDSGSPLMSRVSGSQIAITSWAFPCALGVPDMHTRLSSFEHYIKDIMAIYQ